MGNVNKYFSEHVACNSGTHVCVGLGIAWLLGMAWQGYSVISLVLGIVFLAVGIISHVYAMFAK